MDEAIKTILITIGITVCLVLGYNVLMVVKDVIKMLIEGIEWYAVQDQRQRPNHRPSAHTDRHPRRNRRQGLRENAAYDREGD